MHVLPRKCGDMRGWTQVLLVLAQHTAEDVPHETPRGYLERDDIVHNSNCTGVLDV